MNLGPDGASHAFLVVRRRPHRHHVMSVHLFNAKTRRPKIIGVIVPEQPHGREIVHRADSRCTSTKQHTGHLIDGRNRTGSLSVPLQRVFSALTADGTDSLTIGGLNTNAGRSLLAQRFEQVSFIRMPSLIPLELHPCVWERKTWN